MEVEKWLHAKNSVWLQLVLNYSSIVTSSQIPSFNSTFTYLHNILLIVNCWQLNSYCMASNESGCYYRMTTLGSISLNQNVKQPSSHTVHITVGLPFVHQISTSARWNSGSSGVSQCNMPSNTSCLRDFAVHWNLCTVVTLDLGHNHLAVILRWLAYTEHWMSLLTLWISLVHCEYRSHWYTFTQHWYQNQWTRCISQFLLCMGALRPITKVCCQNYAHSIRADCILTMQVGNRYMKWLFYIIQRE